MTDSLIIRVPETEEAVASWLIFDAVAGRVGLPQSGPLTLAAALAANRRVIALVPGVEVLLAEPELPVRGSARLAQVVPFALEEQLATDVETLHFAIGRREATRKGTPVAVVTRERMDRWLAYLRSAQLNPSALYIDSTALPTNPGQSVLLIEGDRLFVRHPGELPLVLDAQPLIEALELANLFVESEPRSVVAYLSQADWSSHQVTLDGVRERLANLKVQLLPHGALPLLANEVVAHPPINLLQGTYAPRTHSAVQWRNWRVAAILFAALVGLNLVGKAIDIWRLGKEERALDAAVAQVFREAMPGEQNAVDARRRMEARLAGIRGSSGAGGENLLEVLGGIAQAFQQVPGTSIEALSFRGNTLDLKVAAKDVAALDSLQSLAAKRGLQAELQSSDARADGVEGRIQIKGRGRS
jgi:general secretion pathway protein L